MKTKIAILFCFAFIGIASLNAQKEFEGKVNLRNAKGQKEGLWIEEDKYNKYYTTYQNGIENGIFYVIKKSNYSLFQMGKISNGEYVIYCMFSDDGHLMTFFKDFSKNKNFTTSKFLEGYIPPYKCYCIDYYPNGNIEKEGWGLWTDSPVADFTEYGEWKYYDDTGKLTETKTFK